MGRSKDFMNMVELFGFGGSSKPTVSNLDSLARKYDMRVDDINVGNHKLFIKVNWIDNKQLGRTDSFLDAVINKGFSSNVYAVDKNGSYVQKAAIGDKQKKFATGRFDKPFTALS